MNFFESLDSIRRNCTTMGILIDEPIIENNQFKLKLTSVSGKQFSGSLEQIEFFLDSIVGFAPPIVIESVSDVSAVEPFPIEEVSFEEIKQVWTDNLWPGREDIETHSTMLYKSGYDMSIKNYKPVFLAIKDQDKIVAVNSGHQTTINSFRSRGLWVDNTYRGNGFSKRLLLEIDKYAKLAGCDYVWSIPRQQSLHAYTNAGYVQDGEFFIDGMKFGPNCFVNKQLES